jgi:hypothetical protein
MSDNGQSQQTSKKADLSPRWVLGFKLGLVIGMGGALTVRDIVDETGLSERQAYRLFSYVVDDKEIPVSGDGGFLRLQK